MSTTKFLSDGQQIVASNSRRLLLFVVFGCIAGCSTAIRFSADTTIAADGSVFRTTKLAISGGSEENERVSKYELPAGGTWTNAAPEPPSVDENERPARVYNRVYAVTRDFARGEVIPPDFRRFGISMDRAAENAVDVRKRNFWIVETYRYREVFSDVPTPAGASTALRDVYSLLTEMYAEALAELVGISASEAATRFTAYADPIFDAVVAYVSTECFVEREEPFDCFEAAEDEESLAELVRIADDPDAFLYELEQLFPAPSGMARDDWLERLESEIVDAVDIEDLAELPEYEAFLARAVEDVFGVHSLAIFEVYPFALTLRMPGTIVSTNATARQGELLSWEFGNESFTYAPYSLHASSRVVHIDRLIVLLWVVGVFAIVGGWYWRKRQSARAAV